MDVQMSLFDDAIEQKVDQQVDVLSVVNAKFISAEKRNWQDLFEGFDEIYAITFSSGIDFVSKVLDKYKYGEVIFGCENVIGDDVAAVMAVQATLVETITKRKSAKRLAEMVENESLKLFVSRDTRSHEKIFCLKAEDGRTRVITGSANMSASAFCGYQRENICVFDDEEAYEWYKGRFDSFRETCADNVNHKALNATIDNPDHLKDNIDEIPVSRTAQEKKYVFLEPATDKGEDYEFVTSVKGLEADLKPMLPKTKKESNKIILSSEHVKSMQAKNKPAREEKEIRAKKLPQLHLDYELQSLSFNGKPYNMNPDRESVVNDISALFNFMNGYSVFCGDILDAQRDYYAFMNWFFASPFMAYLRSIADATNYDVYFFPVNGIIYGDSNGGKTTFLRLLSKMMCNKKIPKNSSADYTGGNIEDLKRGIEGIPIVIDDLDKTQFQNHSGKVIKDDEWGIKDHFINYPAVAITTNKLPSIEPAISKRCIAARINIKISKEDAAKNSKRLNESLNNVGNSFYCEYVRRMFSKVMQMADLMKENNQDYFPDIFRASSETLYEIMQEMGIEIPEYAQVLGYNDYFGEKVVGKNAINKFLNAWKTEPQQFKIDKKANRLIYTMPENANMYELKYINEELPPHLDSKVASRTLTMKLDAAEEFFEVKFKKKLFSK